MNEFLRDLKIIEQHAADLCSILQIMQGNAKANVYEDDEEEEEDKKSIRYFTCEMTEQEYQKFFQQGQSQKIKHKMTPIDLKEESIENQTIPEAIIKYYRKHLLNIKD